MALVESFFAPWPRWAQICFVLGIFLVITAFVATAVTVRKRRTLRRQQLSEVADMAERGIPVYVSGNIPFGVRALLQSSPIEGVWNAHTTTALHGPTSRNRSPLIRPMKMLQRSKRDTSSSSIPSLDISNPSTPTKPAESWKPSGAICPQSAAQSLLFDTHRQHSQEPAATLPTRKNSRSITISYSGSSSTSKTPLSFGAAEAESLLSGPVSLTEPAESDHPPAKLKLRRSVTLTKTRRKFVIGGKNSPNTLIRGPQKPHSIEVDVIDRMNAHRRLHSAEQGQLVPRTRPYSEDNAGVNLAVGYMNFGP